MEISDLCNEMSRAVNTFGSENTSAMVRAMVYQHPTLQQKFTGDVVLQVVKEMAIRYRNKNYDLRNEEACKVCDKMWSIVEEMYNLKEDTPFCLPFI